MTPAAAEIGPSTPLVDTHCHLDDPAFAADFDEVVARARAAGVAHFVCVGCARAPGNVPRSVETARKLGTASATVGVHPHDASALDVPLLDALEKQLASPAIVAVGEMGLDFHYDHSPRDVQATAFRTQIALARAAKKPIVVHSRSAPDETLLILREEHARDVGGILHCFSEDAAFAKAALDLGFVASFSGIVTFRSAAAIREAARVQPLDALLVETDAPYLAPVPRRGKRNEPAFVAHTAREIAALRGVDEDEIRAASTANACRVLSLRLDSFAPAAATP